MAIRRRSRRGKESGGKRKGSLGNKERELRSSGEGDLVAGCPCARGSVARRRRRSRKGRGGGGKRLTAGPHLSARRGTGSTGQPGKGDAGAGASAGGPSGPNSAAGRPRENVFFFFSDFPNPFLFPNSFLGEMNTYFEVLVNFKILGE